MTDETKTAAREALAEVLYQQNGHAWYGRDLGEWTSPESRIGRNQHERDRWLRQADAILASPALDAIVAERIAAALLGARDDIRARYREFSRLHADEQYLSALNDAWGLVNNRIPRAALTERTAEPAADQGAEHG